jgi:hypothetical protein
MILMSITGFVRLAILFLAIYLVVRGIRLFFNLRETTAAQGRKNTSKPAEGETVLRFNRKGEKIIDKDKGEYVDFEELKE